MTLAIHVQSPYTRPMHPSATRIGDTVAELAARYAAEMNRSPFATALRERHVPQRSYLAFIATMYPVVVGFNRALIRSIAKVDHVRRSSFVKVLAEQLQEEQAHNQLWRGMLDVFDIDHERMYDDLEEYLAGFSREELDRHTAEVLASVRRDLRAGSRRVFPDAFFPDAVLALCHHLWRSATDDEVSYWEHFASQAAIEMTIWEVVTTTILPGVAGHPELDRGMASTHWWMEHGRLAAVEAEESRRQTDEEKHLALSRMALNRSETANAVGASVAARAEDTLRLFAASLMAQDPREHTVAIERYLRA